MHVYIYMLSRTLIDNRIVCHAYLVGAWTVGIAPTIC